jgi:TetR/AcrR family transcriptional regulator, transcriptional repressor for nem operon
MRYSSDYKKQARAKLVDASGRHAKQHGFTSSGMADLAAAAGVTTGSLYKHFNSKSDLFITMMKTELKRTADMYDVVDAADTKQVLRTLSNYLSLNHVHHPELGCPLPSLTPEIGRADSEIKLAFEQGVQAIHANVNALTGDASSAWTIMAQNVGAVMIARAMQSEILQKELLKAVREAGELLIDSNKPAQTSERS